MFFYRTLKRIENKIMFLIDLSSFEFWRNILSFSMPTQKKIKFDFQIIDLLIKNHQKEKILLIGNAKTSKTLGNEVNSFDGDIIRFNRFQDGYDDYLGSKTTHWFLSNGLTFDERNYVYNNLDRIKQTNPDLIIAS